MLFSLRNGLETNKIINELKNKNFTHLDICEKQLLTFIEIEDNKFNSYIKRDIKDLSKFVLHIYRKFKYEIYVDIPFEIIETIDELEC